MHRPGLTFKGRGWCSPRLTGDFILPVSSPAVQHGKTLLRNEECAPFTRPAERWMAQQFIIPSPSQSHGASAQSAAASVSLAGVETSSRDADSSGAEIFFFSFPSPSVSLSLSFLFSHPSFSSLSYSLGIRGDNAARRPWCGLTHTQTDTRSLNFNHGFMTVIFLQPPPPPFSPPPLLDSTPNRELTSASWSFRLITCALLSPEPGASWLARTPSAVPPK